MIHLLAPAKINLSLEIIGPLDSNYYEVRTVLQSVSLFDELFFDHLKDTRLNIDNSINFDEEDIVLKAARLLQRKFDVSLGASIRVIKNIPISAGLGGGSSDAATTLLGLNKLWRLNLSDDELHDVASELGSDVPFFINKQPATISGIGDNWELLSAGWISTDEIDNGNGTIDITISGSGGGGLGVAVDDVDGIFSYINKYATVTADITLDTSNAGVNTSIVVTTNPVIEVETGVAVTVGAGKTLVIDVLQINDLYEP